mmetsp:Transcript_47768/g.121886  ORF Transcript_47768/g.121886 Transcript_47768/m.121886 type:complete len:350 (-) Transcript_47768:293-1342(-)
MASLESCSVLVTGGLGFIGSHTCLSLLDAGCTITVIDNLHNSFEVAYERMKELAGDKASKLAYVKLDLLDMPGMQSLFKSNKFDACIHFAGLKAVGESVAKPMLYYNNNIVGTCNLIECMRADPTCKKIVFSSSATVYGEPEYVPLDENHRLNAINPYGRTKLFIEEILRDVCRAEADLSCVLLRYFNPVGAHPSGRIGESPVGIPNNLMPFVQQVAVGKRPELTVFGNDYDTVDGTGVRDYIHVMDLADGHTAALRKITSTPSLGCVVYNLGTGKGTSVLEMVSNFEAASGKKVPYKIAARRDGDAPAVWASTEYAEKELGWKAKFTIKEMCEHQWNWAKNNPNGYES